MQHFRYLIIGGGIAGTTAAETIRKGDPEGSIGIVTWEAYPLYSRVLLSKPAFLLGTQPFESVWMKTPEWYTENKITYLTERTATALSPDVKTVTLKDGEVLEYEKLLLATGTHTRHWKIAGADKKGIHYLRTLSHAKAIIEDLKGKKAHAIMIGSACVTFEVAEILRSQGTEVTEVMRENYFWEPSLSREEGMLVENKLVEHGVKIIRNAEVIEVLGGERVEGVKLNNGMTLSCDTIFSFIGVTVPVDWLTSSGLTLDRAVRTNEYLETNIKDIWAAGDCARFDDVILEEPVLMGNWMNARAQGELAGNNMLGLKRRFEMISFHSSHGFGDTIGFAGDGRALPDRTYIMRGDPTKNSYGRLILRGERIVGATMVNRVQELATVVALIKAKLDTTEIHDKLADGNFDLKTLLSHR